MDGSNHGAYIRVDTYVAARVGKDAMLKTALLPALTMGIKNAAPYVGADSIKNVPLAVRRPRMRGGEGRRSGWGPGTGGTGATWPSDVAGTHTTARACLPFPFPFPLNAGPCARRRLRRERPARAGARLKRPRLPLATRRAFASVR